LASNLNSKRILVVDDDPYMVAALVTPLTNTGAAIETASDGIEAIEKPEEFQPDLVILDARLPRPNAFLVLEDLMRSHDECKNRPSVIVLSDVKGKRHRQ
jgi:DNA-binding response OmpR family regulator